MRICTKCIHCYYDWPNGCQRIDLGIDIVNGARKYKTRSCYKERRNANLFDTIFGYDRCGPEGKYYVEKVKPNEQHPEGPRG